jgi:hypothetical protein
MSQPNPYPQTDLLLSRDAGDVVLSGVALEIDPDAAAAWGLTFDDATSFEDARDANDDIGQEV